MLFYKTAEEIDLIRESCLLVSETHAMLKQYMRPGVQTLKLDSLAFEFINDNNAKPAFLNYNSFPYSLYISVNNTVVHGKPSKIELHDGDVVTVDCGVHKNNFFGESCYTYAVGEVNEKHSEFIRVAKQTLLEGIMIAKEGKRIGDIGYTINEFVLNKGFKVACGSGGSGIGKQLHEEPKISNTGLCRTGLKLKRGMVITISPKINYISRQCELLDDGWTLKTKDVNISAHFKHTIAIDGLRPLVLSNFEIIEKQ